MAADAGVCAIDGGRRVNDEGLPLYFVLCSPCAHMLNFIYIEDSFSRWELLLPGVFVLDEIHGNAGVLSALLYKGEIEWTKRI